MDQTPKANKALVTGASSGIGATYADRLAKRGYDLVVIARDKKRLDALAAKLTSQTGVTVEVLRADLTAAPDLAQVEKKIREDEKIEMVVNCAGIGPQDMALASRMDYLEAMIQLNVVALHRLTLAAACVFAPRHAGTIINIASVVALIPERFNATYSATKAFVLALTQGLNSEISPRGVRMQAVLPGLTRTEIFERAGFDMARLDPKMIMEVDDMVDAALAGLDQGELVTIPSLPDTADWKALDVARYHLGPNLSHGKPAARYGVKSASSAA